MIPTLYVVTAKQQEWLERWLTRADALEFQPGWAHIRFKCLFGFWHPDMKELKVLGVGDKRQVHKDAGLTREPFNGITTEMHDRMHGATDGSPVDHDDDAITHVWDDEEFGQELFTAI